MFDKNADSGLRVALGQPHNVVGIRNAPDRSAGKLPRELKSQDLGTGRSEPIEMGFI